MPNLNSLFFKFNDEISLSSTKKDKLRKGRNALRKRIKDDFKESERKVPNFCGQGSFNMKTIINPLSKDEYDIDDGVYINGYSNGSQDDWPATATVHKWIKDAVDGHTSIDPVDKDTCIRVIYAEDYHVDLPSYILKGDIAYLAHKRDGWIESDPKAFTSWFNREVIEKGEQLRRSVKYLKAWKDYKNIDLKGITITILVVQNFYSYNDRDDSSLLGTVVNVLKVLEDKFECIKPVVPNENLLEGYSQAKQEQVINALENLKNSLDQAINENDEIEASKILREEFGDGFPKGESNNTKESSGSGFIRTGSPGVINNDGHSA